MDASPPPRRPARSTAELRLRGRNALIESRLTPNAISLTGLALHVVAAVLLLDERWFIGGIAFIVGSVCDTLDGRYARTSGKGSPFGAFLDSTLDRMEEAIILTVVAAHYADEADKTAVLLCAIAIAGSLLVSYTRARAEALGVECKVGFANRAVRVVILSIGLLFAEGTLIDDVDLLVPAVAVLAGLSSITVLQRILHVRKQLLALPPPPDVPVA
jgi:CDP-diacylglycerol---glycerol-3-phosphate 3-phosphatidyltransferase